LVRAAETRVTPAQVKSKEQSAEEKAVKAENLTRSIKLQAFIKNRKRVFLAQCTPTPTMTPEQKEKIIEDFSDSIQKCVPTLQDIKFNLAKITSGKKTMVDGELTPNTWLIVKHVDELLVSIDKFQRAEKSSEILPIIHQIQDKMRHLKQKFMNNYVMFDTNEPSSEGSDIFHEECYEGDIDPNKTDSANFEKYSVMYGKLYNPRMFIEIKRILRSEMKTTAELEKAIREKINYIAAIRLDKQKKIKKKLELNRKIREGIDDAEVREELARRAKLQAEKRTKRYIKQTPDQAVQPRVVTTDHAGSELSTQDLLTQMRSMRLSM
jgi:hypothetical protein